MNPPPKMQEPQPKFTTIEQYSQRWEESLEILCEQVFLLRKEVEELKKSLQDQVYPKLEPKKGRPLSSNAELALDRLARIRRLGSQEEE